MQNVTRNPMVPFVFFSVRSPQKITFVCMTSPTIRRNAVEINLAFGGQILIYRFEIWYCRGPMLVV